MPIRDLTVDERAQLDNLFIATDKKRKEALDLIMLDPERAWKLAAEARFEEQTGKEKLHVIATLSGFKVDEPEPAPKPGRIREDIQIDVDGRMHATHLHEIIGSGDIIFWENEGPHVGRVIGTADVPEFDDYYLCVAELARNELREEFVDISSVTRRVPIGGGRDDDSDEAILSKLAEKVAWLFGPDFCKARPDTARQCRWLSPEELKCG